MSKLTCAFCQHLIHKCVIALCGHSYCETCLEEYLIMKPVSKLTCWLTQIFRTASFVRLKAFTPNCAINHWGRVLQSIIWLGKHLKLQRNRPDKLKSKNRRSNLQRWSACLAKFKSARKLTSGILTTFGVRGKWKSHLSRLIARCVWVFLISTCPRSKTK